MRNIINDGVEASARKTQARFQIIQVSSSAEPWMRLEKSEKLPEISLSRPQPHHRFYYSHYLQVSKGSDQNQPRSNGDTIFTIISQWWYV